MITISHTKPDELYICGSIEDLQNFVTNFSSLVERNSNEFKVKAKRIDPTPYDHALGYLDVRVTDGPIKISVISDFVLIEGSVNSMSSLSSFFDFDKSSHKGDHRHHEFFSGNEYIRSDSIPTVIGVG
ncbi:hypothetical protein MNBD_GAMMA12-1654 [hydrothermal vent metagenome]|uniref:Uncharacterized protein n=1 Tax=hydrothermal vent metagenome TaxID=652676 RepID=A0A3B0Y435_9ZZZZ